MKSKYKTLANKVASAAIVAGALFYSQKDLNAGEKYNYTIFHKERKVDSSSIEKAIIKIESDGNPKAYKNSTGASGLMGITPIVVKEWNEFHPNEKYSINDLFDAKINKKIGAWYLNERIINRYLPNYGLEITTEHVGSAWNWGIGKLKRFGSIDNVEKRKKLPGETRKFLDRSDDILSNNPLNT